MCLYYVPFSKEGINVFRIISIMLHGGGTLKSYPFCFHSTNQKMPSLSQKANELQDALMTFKRKCSKILRFIGFVC